MNIERLANLFFVIIHIIMLTHIEQFELDSALLFFYQNKHNVIIPQNNVHFSFQQQGSKATKPHYVKYHVQCTMYNHIAKEKTNKTKCVKRIAN